MGYLPRGKKVFSHPHTILNSRAASFKAEFIEMPGFHNQLFYEFIKYTQKLIDLL